MWFDKKKGACKQESQLVSRKRNEETDWYMLCVTVAMQDSLIAEPTWQATQSTHVQMIYVLNGGDVYSWAFNLPQWWGLI